MSYPMLEYPVLNTMKNSPSKPSSKATGAARLTGRDARQRYPRVYAALDAPDAQAFLAALDATGLAALLAEFQALGPVRLERSPAENRAFQRPFPGASG